MPDNRHENHAGIVLAAGMARRFGSPKQLAVINNKILLARVLETAIQSSLRPVILVLGFLADRIIESLRSPEGIASHLWSRYRVVVNKEYGKGLSTSVRAGLDALPESVESAMFIPGDLIGINHAIIESLINISCEKKNISPIRPRYGGRPGAPMIWPRRYFDRLYHITGDKGGSQLIESIPREEIVFVDFPIANVPMDIDTQNDYRLFCQITEFPDGECS